jgi:hypothetical protein
MESEKLIEAVKQLPILFEISMKSYKDVERKKQSVERSCSRTGSRW